METTCVKQDNVTLSQEIKQQCGSHENNSNQSDNIHNAGVNSEKLTTIKRQNSKDNECTTSCKKLKLLKGSSSLVSSSQSVQSQKTPNNIKVLEIPQNNSDQKKVKKHKKKQKKSKMKNKEIRNAISGICCSPGMQTPKNDLPNMNDSWNFDLPTPPSASKINDDSISEDTSYSLNNDIKR